MQSLSGLTRGVEGSDPFKAKKTGIAQIAETTIPFTKSIADYDYDYDYEYDDAADGEICGRRRNRRPLIGITTYDAAR